MAASIILLHAVCLTMLLSAELSMLRVVLKALSHVPQGTGRPRALVVPPRQLR